MGSKTLLSSLRFATWPIFGGDGLAATIARGLLSVVLLFALADIAFVLVTYARDKEGLGQNLLTLQADDIAKAVTVDGGNLRLMPAQLYREPIGSAQMAFAVYDRQGREIAFDGPWELAHGLTPPITSVSSETRRDDHATGFFLHGARRTTVQGQPIWVVMNIQGEGLRPFWPVVVNEVVQHVGVPLLPLVLLLLALNVTVVRRALSPLAAAAREVEALEPRRIERRLTMPDSPREVQRLVGAVNAALDRIESAIRALRDFTADAAHELRTPLAILSMEVDELPASTAKEKLREDVANMTRSVAQMLDMASADALLIPQGTVADLSAVGAQAVAQLTPLAIRKRRSIRFVDEHPARIDGHAEAIGRAVRNLIENALTHAPEETVVEVTAGPGSVTAVRDHGPGIPEGKRGMVLKRFWRGDRSRTDGSGLGLAIANRIAEAHGGRIEIAEAPDGGALIRLWLAPQSKNESTDAAAE
ncbi:MAG: HAMP domain-containing histidine kinase [Alphaproteobacteria bacterium]|nr:HAMP domain-containing histidine kinase [Alphaproteobacteria bacterium]